MILILFFLGAPPAEQLFRAPPEIHRWWRQSFAATARRDGSDGRCTADPGVMGTGSRSSGKLPPFWRHRWQVVIVVIHIFSVMHRCWSGKSEVFMLLAWRNPGTTASSNDPSVRSVRPTIRRIPILIWCKRRRPCWLLWSESGQKGCRWHSLTSCDIRPCPLLNPQFCMCAAVVSIPRNELASGYLT